MSDQSLISDRKVNPSGPEDADILFIGEAPGYDEDKQGIPFVGESGDNFNSLLGTIGLSREDVRVTNICCYRPNNNKFDLLVNSRQLKEGIEELRDFISTRKPKWVVVLGAKPLEYLLGKKGKRNGIESWRGSVIERDGQRYFAMLHPANIGYSEGTKYPIMAQDFLRLEKYYRDGYEFPKHDFLIDPEGIELEEALREIELHKRITCDLEGVKGTFHIRCAGFGLSNSRAICLFNHSYSGLHVTFEQSIRRILENPEIEIVFQNGFGYDILMLQEHGIEVANYKHDTMIGAHVLEPELPYSLAYNQSIYTDEPYHKHMVRSDDEDDGKGVDADSDNNVLGEYNCIDCVVDYQWAEKQCQEITEQGEWETYDYKHSLIPTGIALTKAGMMIDQERKDFLRAAINYKRLFFQAALNTLAGFPVNVKSPIHMKKLLIDEYGLPQRYKRAKGGSSKTYDEDAIVSYLSIIQTKIDEYRTAEKREVWEFRLGACKCILLIRGYRQLLSNYFDIPISPDGRLRSVYNLCAATETGRASAHKYIDQTGCNSQTFPREQLEIDENEMKIILEKLNASKLTSAA